ncbi:MAG: hypothetical protein KDA46_02225 [Parvularculaceae bacterium]|nr:hypothetical protein [Parvularculaceae bacterium]
MKSQSLLILGAVFASAFAGRGYLIAEALASEGAGAQAPGAGEVQCITGEMAQALKEGFEKLDERKLAMAGDEQLAQAAADHASTRIAELEAINAELSRTLEKYDAARTGEMKRVAVIYSQMKPQMAGAIFDKMAPEFAAGLLMSMDGESASAIMATLNADRAYVITVMMANMAANGEFASTPAALAPVAAQAMGAANG